MMAHLIDWRAMAVHYNELHIIAFDPGGKTGWAKFIIDIHAFSRPKNKVLRHLKHWESGEFKGHEHDQLRSAVALIEQSTNGPMPFNATVNIISEDFDLKQTIGGRDLVSPIRINAVLDWECAKRGQTLTLQKRSERTSVTKERLQLYSFNKRFAKDEFAAMQHAVVWMRKLKQQSLGRPWKLSDGISHNAYWDCQCANGEKCDMMHPRD
jgi:hypothetical protein